MIQNATVVGDNIAPDRYNVETEQRGTPGYTMRSHAMGEILRNPRRWRNGYQSPASKAMDFGSILDCVLLTPDQWFDRYCVVPADAPRKPNAAQLRAKKPSAETIAAIEWWRVFTDNNPGQTITSENNAEIRSAANRLRDDPLLDQLIANSKHAVMIVAEWHDTATGLIIPVKALIDIVPAFSDPVFSNSLWDLKTTASAAPNRFMKDAQRYGYALQAGFYSDMHRAATGEDRGDFGHIVIENYHPYEFRSPPPLLSQRFLGHGKLLYQRALSVYCKALASGVWPSYDRVGQWPITDCDDFYLSIESVYDDIEPLPPEPERHETTDDLIP